MAGVGGRGMIDDREQTDPKLIEYRQDLKKLLIIKGISRVSEGTWARTREPIPDGKYSLESLADILISGWISYYKCRRHCAWYDTCPCPTQKEFNPDKSPEIRCGIGIMVLRNCLRAWWSRLLVFSMQDIQKYLDALYYLVEYVLDSHFHIGTLVYNWNPEWWGLDMAARITACPSWLRKDLESLAESLQNLPFSFFKPQVVFVEGEAEETFLKVFQDNRQLSYVVRVEVMGGKANATRERIPLSLLLKQGYQVSLQLDADGSKTRSYRDLAQKIKNKGGTVFIFKRDFESAFPLPALIQALSNLDIHVDENWLSERLNADNIGGILSAINQKYNCIILKPLLAKELGRVVVDNWDKMLRDFGSNEITLWIRLLQMGKDIEEPDTSKGTLKGRTITI